MSQSQTRHAPDNLRARYDALQARTPSPVRARDAADALGVSEGALCEARRGAGEVVALRAPAGPHGLVGLLAEIAPLGDIMALTRNAHCVIETTGPLAAPVFDAQGARVTGAIEQRIDPGQWFAAYAVSEQTPHGAHRSIQIYDPAGDAVLKLYATPGTDAAGFTALIAALEGAPEIAFDAAPEAVAAAPASAAAEPVSPAAAQAALEQAAATGARLAVTVGNRGCVQTYRGVVESVKPTGPWINVLDPAFNLHMRWDRIAAARLLNAAAPVLEFLDARGVGFCAMGAADAAAETQWLAIAAALPR